MNVISVSMSEPHTCQLDCNFIIYMYTYPEQNGMHVTCILLDVSGTETCMLACMFIGALTEL